MVNSGHTSHAYGPGRTLRFILVCCVILTFAPHGFVAFISPPPVYAADLLVNSTGDEGDFSPGDGECAINENPGADCTLRAAIEEANALGGGNTISFDIEGTSPHVIAPKTPFEPIGFSEASIFIDGYTQPGASENSATVGSNARIQIELSGNSCVECDSGLELAGDGAEVRGLAIYGGFTDGIRISASITNTISGNIVAGNFIGLRADGTPDGVRSAGVRIEPFGGNNNVTFNIVGGTALEDRNIISANRVSGITLRESGEGSVSSNSIQGNFIGTNATGTLNLGNSQYGVEISGGASDNVIGGTDPDSGNTIAFNGNAGVRLDTGIGNAILSNAIFGNAAPIVLDNNANDNTPAPIITTAAPVGNSTNIQGWMRGPPDTYELQFFRGTACGSDGQAEARQLLTTTTLSVTVPFSGTAPFSTTISTSLLPGDFVTGTATDIEDNTSTLADCVAAGPDNTAWYTALPLNVNPQASIQQYLSRPEQMRWYRFATQPDSRVQVRLSNLPGVYDLAIFGDLGAAAQALASSTSLEEDLLVQNTQINYDVLETSNFVTNTLSPESLAPSAFTNQALSPGEFRQSVISTLAVSPFQFSPFQFSPFQFSPFQFSPFQFSPFQNSPFQFSPFDDAETEASLVLASNLLNYSALEGTQPRELVLNTWTRTGDLYIAVFGRNGTFVPDQPFTLEVQQQNGQCGAIEQPAPDGALLSAQANDYRTIFLTYPSRLVGTAAERSTLAARLNTFANRSEVRGAIVNVGLDGQVRAASRLADDNPACPLVQNYFAQAVKDIVDRYREANPNLAYVVIVGGDQTIPFFRYPDQALLGHESDFVPPVLDNTPAQASLRLGYVLGQDEYGSSLNIPFKSTILPVPILAVGRLVETAAEATAMLDTYIGMDGVLTPESALVSGYDFHFDSSVVISQELALGMDRPVDGLLSESTESHQLPDTWTATDLRNRLLNNRYDILYLAGHFSDGAMLAADYATILRAQELLDPQANLSGALVISPGCHSGYNTIDDYAVNGITFQPDWAQVFARKGATLISGTGYQYGDTESIEFAEELYVKLAEQLRLDTGPLPIGQALVLAKQRYLLESAIIRGLDLKTLTIGTLFGLPMMQVNMTGERTTLPANPSIINSTDPAGPFDLRLAEVTVVPNLTTQQVPLTSLEDGSIQTATYISGTHGIVSPPAEPVLPLEQRNVSDNTVPGNQLRGVGLWSADYTDTDGILPLTGAPATELRGVHVTFPTQAFYPERIWSANYFNRLLSPSSGQTRLHITPAQFIASEPGSPTGTLRTYGEMQFRLYYSNNTSRLPSGVIPATAGPPAILNVISRLDSGDVYVRVVVNETNNVPVQAVWMTYTGLSAPLYEKWQSFDLSRMSGEPNVWEGTLSLPDGYDPDDLRFMLQAVSAAGYHTLSTNQGQYYQVGSNPGMPSDPGSRAATKLNLITAPANANYAAPTTFQAQLRRSDNNAVLAGRLLTLGVGTLIARATTDSNGVATFTPALRLPPGTYPVNVVFAGAPDLLPATTTTESLQITIAKASTSLELITAITRSSDSKPISLAAILRDGSGTPISGEPVVFIVNGPGGPYTSVSRTTIAGRAEPEQITVPPGRFTITAYFGGSIPLSDGTVNLSNERYSSASTSVVVNAGSRIYLPIVNR